MTDIDLNFIARQLDRVMTDIATLRDEVRVQNAITMRLDGGQSAMLAELRAIRDQIVRMNDRIRKLEDSGVKNDQA
jgi:hypothetical protein